MFFPMPPYDGLQFNALRSGTGFNFTVSNCCLQMVVALPAQRARAEACLAYPLVQLHAGLACQARGTAKWST
jgi:hypothetical protein